jgi:hypothetical protein
MRTRFHTRFASETLFNNLYLKRKSDFIVQKEFERNKQLEPLFTFAHISKKCIEILLPSLRQCEEQHALSHRTLRINQKFIERSFLVPIYTRKYIPTQNKFQHTKNARRRDRTGGGGETEEICVSQRPIFNLKIKR